MPKPNPTSYNDRPSDYSKPNRCQNPALCKKVMAAGHAVNAAFKALSWQHWDELECQMDGAKDNPIFQGFMGYVQVSDTPDQQPPYRVVKGETLVNTLSHMTDEGDWEVGYFLAKLQYESALPATAPFDVVAAAIKKLRGIDLENFTDRHWFVMHRVPDFWPDEVC